MNRFLQAMLLGMGVTIAAEAVASAAGSVDGRTAAFLQGFDQVGRHFEQNLGQLPANAAFAFRADTYRFDLIEDGIQLELEGNRMMLGEPMQIRFRGCNLDCSIAGTEKLPFTVMYRVPADEGRRHMASIPTYAVVHCRQIYHGIDLRYRVAGDQVEYDFLVQPGADPAVIEIAINGAREVVPTTEGDLRIAFAVCDLIQHRPVAYQHIEGVRHPVQAGYDIGENGLVRFSLGEYDASAPLVIDPLISVHLHP
jgi:hypothetical protein